MISEAQIDACIAEMFRDMDFSLEPAGLYDPLRYMISIGGKRIRPRLCLLSYAMFRDELGEEILEPAAALEVFHTFTLIHDDIMDRSPKRRGRETVWKKWGEDTAILSGDVMSIDSYRRISKAPVAVLKDVLELFNRTAAEVCEGQQYDMDFENLEEVPMADYMKMIGLKTAVLLACSAKMGALIAGASAAEADALYDYGYKLGLAFQVADDWLDAYGDEKVFGKPIGGDIVNNKKCWLTTRAQEKLHAASDDAAILRLKAAMAMPVGSPEEREAKIAAVRGIYDSLSVGEDARAEIEKLTDEAMKAVDCLNPGKLRREMLARYASALVGRTR